ncbi:MAG: hypothetical protein WCH39_02090 [Schlesneria sp.]
MNSITVNQVGWSVVSLALIVVVLIGLALLGLVTNSAYRIVARHRRTPTIPVTTRFTGRTTLREIARCWVAPTGVMAVFVALSGEFSHEFERWFSLTPSVTIPAVIEHNESPVRIENANLRYQTDPGLSRPSWIDEGNNQTGDIQRIVLSSGLWATEAEASRELLPRTASIVRTDFAERHKGPFDRPGHRFLSDERLANIAVKRQYLERIEQDHGSIVLPMCRLWQQIEVSPEVRTEIYPAWKSAVLGNRVVLIGALLSLMTLIANTASLFVKLNRLPSRSTTFAAVVAASSATAWIVGDLLLAMRLCQ